MDEIPSDSYSLPIDQQCCLSWFTHEERPKQVGRQATERNGTHTKNKTKQKKS